MEMIQNKKENRSFFCDVVTRSDEQHGNVIEGVPLSLIQTSCLWHVVEIIMQIQQCNYLCKKMDCMFVLI